MNVAGKRAMTERLIRATGGGIQASLRRLHTLRSTRGGVLSDLRLSLDGSADDTSLTLIATGLEGGDNPHIPATITFTIAGDATVYTVAADADVASSAAVVTFTPGLAGAVTAGDLVTLSDYAEWTSIDAMRHGLNRRDIERGIEGAESRVSLSPLMTTDPQRGDLLVLESVTESVLEAVRVAPGSLTVRWDVLVGAAS